MIIEFEDALIKHLKDTKVQLSKTDIINVEPRMYAGEFSNEKTISALIRDGGYIVFTDFREDTYTHQFQKATTFSLYYMGSTPSQNATYRQKIKRELIQLIEHIDDRLLTLKSPNIISTVSPTTLKKIKDDFVEDIGYLAVYERVIKVELRNQAEEEYL